MADAKTLEELATADYWDARYSKPDAAPTYEWFKGFDNLQDFFIKHLPPPTADPRIIHLGCGNSALPHDLLARGYTNQVCVDFSATVIEQMRTKYANEKGIEWQVADIRDMKDFADGEFDIAIDKGTLDAMISGSLWDPPPEVRQNTGAYIDEVVRILKPGGLFCQITWRQPHFVKPALKRDAAWEVQVEEIDEGGGTFSYFAYVMKKFEASTSIA